MEDVGRELQRLRIHFHKVNVLQSETSRAFPCNRQHLWGLINGDDSPCRTHDPSGRDGRLADAGGQVQHQLPWLNAGQLDQAVADRLRPLLKGLPPPFPAGSSCIPVLSLLRLVLNWVE